MIELPRNHHSAADALNIKILGLGGAGSNALDRIHLDGVEGAQLVTLNTDLQSLTASVASVKVQLGATTTRGLGAGGDPEVGYAAADESAEEIRAVLADASMVFLCVGLGGGTGSGASAIVASIAREQGALVVVFATMPFSFEGRRRIAQAEEALTALQHYADIVICFENDKMGDAVSPRAAIQEAFTAADQTISQSVRAVAQLAQRRGLIQLGFDELATALKSQNPRCLFGYGEADGDTRAHAALERALRNPLMDRGRMLAEAENVLVHIAGGTAMTLNEVQLLMEELNRHINDSTRILFGASVDPKLGQRMTVTLISSLPAQMPPPVAALPQPTRASVAPAAPDFQEQNGHAPEPAISFVDSDDEVANAPAAATVRAVPVGGVPRMTPAAQRLAQLAHGGGERRPVKQEQMQFEPVTRGRFEKSEPTIIDGQDLDVPTFLRRNARPK